MKADNPVPILSYLEEILSKDELSESKGESSVSGSSSDKILVGE